ncbi:MAG: V-type ATP synthase subunit I, partial [Clostridiales bacterium]|nr:V-type ATP synthase subunit I [Clostridiales bacterium]
MAIVKMNKLSVIGMKSEKDAMLKRLMDLGVIEVNNGAEKLNDENWQALVVRDGDEATVSEYDRQITLVEQAQKVLSDYGKIKSPMFEVRKEITKSDYEEMLTH